MPIFDWCVVWWGSKNKHHKDTCSKGVGLHIQNLLTIPHSTLNTIGRTYVLIPKTNNLTLPWTITRSKEVQISIRFSLLLLSSTIHRRHTLLQLEFHYMNLIGRKMNRRAPTYPSASVKRDLDLDSEACVHLSFIGKCWLDERQIPTQSFHTSKQPSNWKSIGAPPTIRATSPLP